MRETITIQHCIDKSDMDKFRGPCGGVSGLHVALCDQSLFIDSTRILKGVLDDVIRQC